MLLPVRVARSARPARTECGLIAAWSVLPPTPTEDLEPPGTPHHLLTPPLALRALRALQHRGSDTWGLATVHRDLPGTVGVRVGSGTVPLQEEDGDTLGEGPLVGFLGHVRYATDGSKERLLANAHPVAQGSVRGPFAVAFNGHIERDGAASSATGGDIHRIVKRIADHPARDWVPVFDDLLAEEPSAYSLVVLTPQGVWSVRDRYGYKPLVGATLRDERQRSVVRVVASEVAAMVALAEGMGLDPAVSVWPVDPGSAVWATAGGHSRLRLTRLPRLPKPGLRRCSLEAIYFMRPASCFDRLSIEDFRYRCGWLLAQEDQRAGSEFPFKDTLVVGCPKSGILAGNGYASGACLVYSQVLRLRDGTVRSFIQPTQEARQSAVRRKMHVVGDLTGKQVVVVDDSIVRGHSMGEVIRMLREAGAAKVHVRVASPPVVNVCRWGVDIPDIEELFAGAEPPTADRLGADSLGYLPRAGLEGATGPGWCRACFTTAAAGPSR